jgi:hypothetical protein
MCRWDQPSMFVRFAMQTAHCTSTRDIADGAEYDVQIPTGIPHHYGSPLLGLKRRIPGFAAALGHGVQGVAARRKLHHSNPGAAPRGSSIEELGPPDPAGAAFDVISMQVTSISRECSGTYM